jgi:hypothetical protein
MVRQQLVSLSAVRTDPELEVHSVDDKLFGGTSNDILYPHVSTISSSTDYNGNATCTKHRCNDYGYDVTDSEDCGESKIDIGYHFTWSEDEEHSFVDQHGFGLNVYESIRAISKEASTKIDAVLAVDHVDQLQEEMRKLRSEMKRRSAECSELKGVVQMKDHQIGNLELERDLYKADTTKLANDLETCLIKLRRIGGTASPISVGYCDSVAKEEDKDVTISDIQAAEPIETAKSFNEHDNTVSSTPLDKLKSNLDPRDCTITTGTPSGQAIPSSEKDKASKAIVTSVIPSTLKTNAASSSGKLSQASLLKKDVVTRDGSSRKTFHEEVVANQPKNQQKMLTFAFCRGGTSHKKKNKAHVQPIPTQNSSSSIGAQNHGNTSAARTNEIDEASKQLHRPHGILQMQVYDMGKRLHSSIKTSEDLRRCLAELHLYYEEHIDHFESRLLDACVDRSKRLQFEKEQEVQSLRKQRVVTFNI